MKTTKQTIINVVTLLAMLWTAQAALAFYNPEIGRWANRDPIGENGGINLYAYVSNDPINELDPLGLQTGIATVAANPTLLLDAEELAALNAARAAKAAAAAACAAADLAKEKERVNKCNAIWPAQDAVCAKLFTPAARAKCHSDNDKELQACLRNRNGNYNFDKKPVP